MQSRGLGLGSWDKLPPARVHLVAGQRQRLKPNTDNGTYVDRSDDTCTLLPAIPSGRWYRCRPVPRDAQ